MELVDYLADMSREDTVAVAKGRCDCGLTYEHPLMKVEVVKSNDGVFLETFDGGVYSNVTGFDLLYPGEDNEYWGIWDPSESSDAEFILLERKVFELITNLGMDGLADTDEQIREDIAACNERLDEISEEVYQRGLDSLGNDSPDTTFSDLGGEGIV